MKKINFGLLLLCWLVLLAWSVKAGTDDGSTNIGSALKDDSIRDEPFRDAKVKGYLKKGDKLEIISRDGGWYLVKNDNGKGWVRMLSIRRSEAAKTGFTAQGILGLASGRTGTGKVVLTTGIRGLNEENLKTAQFNEKQLTIFESYSCSKLQALQFAAMGKLRARAIAYLKVESAR